MTVGIICEVKTGHFDRQKLFQVPNIFYSLARLGLVVDPQRTTEQLINHRHVDLEGNVRIAKLLIASTRTEDDGFHCVTIAGIRRFFQQRFEKYKEVKHRDRHFFPSELIQALIDETRSRADQIENK